MKILIHGINFAPEPTGIGKYTGEMAAWLAKQGHEVRVVTAPPYYPDWQVAKGYKAWLYRTENWRGVDVWRCPLWVPPRPGGKRRVVHLLTFTLSSLPVLLRQVFWRPDLVFVAAPAFTCVPMALLTARMARAQAWLHMQDFEVDAAFDMGLLRGTRTRQLATALEEGLMRRFDMVSSISQRMVQRLADKGVQPNRIAFFPNWVDVNDVTPLHTPSEYRQELGLPPDAVVALFSGTLGAKQGLNLLPEAARLLAQRCPQVHVVICGDGVMKNTLKKATQGMTNIHMLPLQPQERLSQLLGMADIHLLPQDPDVADLVMPSKLTAMLSSGRPVVTTANEGTEVANVVRHCGLVSAPDDVVAFASAIERLALNPVLRHELGRSGRLYAESQLAAESVLTRFVQRSHTLVKAMESCTGA